MVEVEAVSVHYSAVAGAKAHWHSVEDIHLVVRNLVVKAFDRLLGHSCFHP